MQKNTFFNKLNKWKLQEKNLKLKNTKFDYWIKYLSRKLKMKISYLNLKEAKGRGEGMIALNQILIK